MDTISKGVRGRFIRGHLISKTVNGVTTRFLYDGLEILAELDSSNNILTSYTHGRGIDQVLATRDHAAAQTLYHLSDSK